MKKQSQLVVAATCIVALHGTARAASYDFSFLFDATAVGQGSFSVPDADLAQPRIDVSEFTSFVFTTGDKTFGLSYLKIGTFIPSTLSFGFSQAGPNGAGYVLNSSSLLLTPGFVVYGSVTSPCYYQFLCGPEYPSVFLGGSIVTGEFGGVMNSVYYNKIVITPSASTVPEPTTAFLLTPAFLALTLLARRRRSAT